MLFNRLSSDIGSQLISQLDRLNNNFERFLEHVGARRLAPTDAKSLDDRTFVGEALTDLEMALKEHAEAAGVEWKHAEDGDSER